MSYEQPYDVVMSAFNIAYELYERDPELAVEISLCLFNRAKEKEHIEAFRRGVWRAIEENGDTGKYYKMSLNLELKEKEQRKVQYKTQSEKAIKVELEREKLKEETPPEVTVSKKYKERNIFKILSEYLTDFINKP